MQPEQVAALVDEATKKSGLVWVRKPGRGERAYGVWHLWQDGSAYVLTGAGEQKLPALDDRAYVTVRSKDKGSRLVTWIASVDVVAPESDTWAAVVPNLLSKRLNLRDSEQAPERWARDCVLYRLTPTGDVTETPDEPSVHSHAQPPIASDARTRVPRPWHLRGRPSVRGHR